MEILLVRFARATCIVVVAELLAAENVFTDNGLVCVEEAGAMRALPDPCVLRCGTHWVDVHRDSSTKVS